MDLFSVYARGPSTAGFAQKKNNSPQNLSRGSFISIRFCKRTDYPSRKHPMCICGGVAFCRGNAFMTHADRRHGPVIETPERRSFPRVFPRSVECLNRDSDMRGRSCASDSILTLGPGKSVPKRSKITASGLLYDIGLIVASYATQGGFIYHPGSINTKKTR